MVEDLLGFGHLRSLRQAIFCNPTSSSTPSQYIGRIRCPMMTHNFRSSLRAALQLCKLVHRLNRLGGRMLSTSPGRTTKIHQRLDKSGNRTPNVLGSPRPNLFLLTSGYTASRNRLRHAKGSISPFAKSYAFFTRSPSNRRDRHCAVSAV